MHYGPAQFQADMNVSAAVLARLEIYAALLVRWQKRLNLVATPSLSDLWRRHMLDSAQIVPYAPHRVRIWLDLGSGAGFPGLPLAIMMGDMPGFHMHLVEANHKKAIFLREVIRATGAPASVHCVRAEALLPETFGSAIDAISARGFAPLDRLLEYAWPFVSDQTQLLLLKGQDVDEELTAAAKCWRIGAATHVSRSDPGGCVLQITEIDRARAI